MATSTVMSTAPTTRMTARTIRTTAFRRAPESPGLLHGPVASPAPKPANAAGPASRSPGKNCYPTPGVGWKNLQSDSRSRVPRPWLKRGPSQRLDQTLRGADVDKRLARELDAADVQSRVQRGRDDGA